MTKYIALTTHAKLKSGGTGSFWFDTNEKTPNDRIVRKFHALYPEIEEMHNVSIHSKERDKMGLAKYSKFRRLDK